MRRGYQRQHMNARKQQQELELHMKRGQLGGWRVRDGAVGWWWR